MVGHQREKLNFLIRIGIRLGDANGKRPQTAVPGFQGQHTGRENPELLQKLPEFWKLRFLLPVGNDQRLLILVHPPTRSLFNRQVREQHFPWSPQSLKHPPLNRVSVFLENRHQNIIKGNKLPHFMGEALGKRATVPAFRGGGEGTKQRLITFC